MCTQTRIVAVVGALGRDRVVEVARAGRVDRERRQRRAGRAAPASPPPLASRASRSTASSKPRGEAAVEHQRLDHVARDVGSPDPADDLGAAAAPRRPDRDEHEVADLRARARRVDRQLAATLGVGGRTARRATTKRPRRSSTAGKAGAPRLNGRAPRARRSAACELRVGVSRSAARRPTTLGLMPAPRRSPPAPRFLPFGQVVLPDGDVDRAAVRERPDLLEDALAVGAGADDRPRGGGPAARR